MGTTAKSHLIIVNDGPYGNERPYNALRLSMNIAKDDAVQLRVFLVGDGVQCAVQGQKPAEGYYNVERMVAFVAKRGEVAT